MDDDCIYCGEYTDARCDGCGAPVCDSCARLQGESLLCLDCWDEALAEEGITR